ncbi:transferrin receptor protein 2 [Latimeria chalumnae]|uniref:transferrin receptor protein 2 n=1 Tax=Latimeria chalumnae TaxID=7897 RepID=UPI00313C05EF
MSSVEMNVVEQEADDDVDTSLTSDMANLVLKRPQDKRKALTCLFLIALLIFVIAFLLGYVTLRETCGSCLEMSHDFESGMVDDPYESVMQTTGRVLYWAELKEMLQKYLSMEEIESTIKRISRKPHPPGSQVMETLALEVRDKFSQFKLDHTWTDSHYVTLQFPDRTNPNRLQFVDRQGQPQENILLEDPDIFCPYSANGSVTGGLVYANYGRKQDFETLRKQGVKTEANLVIVRVGEISFAEKVSNAETFGAAGVLIYPDPADIPQDPRGLGLPGNTALYGHVHFASGDPFTPGFPSFNHTQFPAIQSSGLPKIPAHPISANAATKLLSQLNGPKAPERWNGRLPYLGYRLGANFSNPNVQVKLDVYNKMAPTMIHNVFGSIDGQQEPDQYVIIGAQRDSLGPGAAQSGVGTAILLELAHVFSNMVQNGFEPRRSILFISWDAGEFGSVGATEWLEGYMTMLHLKAIAYFSLDKAVLGDDRFYAQTSPLLVALIEKIIQQVDNPKGSSQSIYDFVKILNSRWEEEVVKDISMESSAYTFTAFGGVPAAHFHFAEDARMYPFLNTQLDTYENLNEILHGRLQDVAKTIAMVVGQMVIRLTHDHLLPLDYSRYSEVLLQYIARLNKYASQLKARGLTLQWIYSARGDYHRAAEKLKTAISNSDEKDDALTRLYNVKIMRAEFCFLSQYVSATEYPFRHILHGHGDHTLHALLDYLALLDTDPARFDEVFFRRQLALLTWTLQGSANALSGDVWNIDNNF